jgi:hypothetical protein
MPERWLVDAMNVIGSRPDGWWRDRPGAMRSLAAQLEGFVVRSGDQVTVVFDGAAVELGQARPARVRAVFAPSADDAIVGLVAQDRDPGELTVVTSDRELAERVRAHEARVEGAAGFRRRLDGV